MSVYKEGFYCKAQIENNSKRIFEDAADFGAVTNKGDNIWNCMKQLVEWYGQKGTRVETQYETGCTVTQTVKLIDEWAVSDNRKKLINATELYKVTFVYSKQQFKDMVGNKYNAYVYIERIEKTCLCCSCKTVIEDPNPSNLYGLVLCGECDEKGLWIDPAGGLHTADEENPAEQYE